MQIITRDEVNFTQMSYYRTIILNVPCCFLRSLSTVNVFALVTRREQIYDKYYMDLHSFQIDVLQIWYDVVDAAWGGSSATGGGGAVSSALYGAECWLQTTQIGHTTLSGGYQQQNRELFAVFILWFLMHIICNFNHLF